METNSSLMLILPGLIVALTAMGVVLLDLFVARKAILAWFASAGLVAAGAAAVGQWLALTSEVGERGSHVEIGFSGMIVLDTYSTFATALFAAIGVLTIMLSDAYLAQRRASRGEFYGLLLFVIAGMIGMVSSVDVIAFFVCFELMSLPTYVLAGYLWRQRRSSEAGLKYFVAGAFSSAILAFGLALAYGSTGQTTYAGIAEGIQRLGGSGGHGMLVVALILVVVGFAFKVAAVPFHAWAPDVYEGAPTPVTAFMSVAVKAAAFAGFARLFVMAVDPGWATWANAMIILAVLTMVVGNVLALPQRNLKRMLAYSSIAHAGYLMLGLVAAGREEGLVGVSAILFYLAAYAFMNIGAFGVLIWIRNRRPFEYTLDEVSGIAREMPWLALFTAFFMVSLTGIPPTIGFWGKFYLFTAVVDSGYTWLAVVAVIMSAVSAYYYLRVVWYMYFRDAADHSEVDAARDEMAVTQQRGVLAAVTVAAVGVVVLGILPEPLLRSAEEAVRLIFGG